MYDCVDAILFEHLQSEWVRPLELGLEVHEMFGHSADLPNEQMAIWPFGQTAVLLNSRCHRTTRCCVVLSVGHELQLHLQLTISATSIRPRPTITLCSAST